MNERQGLGVGGQGSEIVSSDILRENRVPPGQTLTKKWPILHYGEVPSFKPAEWDFRVYGLCDPPLRFTYQEFMALPGARVKADMHCVTRWSRLDNVWEGVSIREVLKRTKIQLEAKAALARSEGNFTANLLLADLLQEDVLLAYANGGEPLAPEHGFPLRLVVPRLYAWKSAKWIRAIEFIPEEVPGFWEQNGYHIRGDPWKEERFWGD